MLVAAPLVVEAQGNSDKETKPFFLKSSKFSLKSCSNACRLRLF